MVFRYNMIALFRIAFLFALLPHTFHRSYYFKCDCMSERVHVSPHFGLPCFFLCCYLSIRILAYFCYCDGAMCRLCIACVGDSKLMRIFVCCAYGRDRILRLRWIVGARSFCALMYIYIYYRYWVFDFFFVYRILLVCRCVQSKIKWNGWRLTKMNIELRWWWWWWWCVPFCVVWASHK